MAVTSGIKTVTALINGQSYTLTKNASTGKYETTITAPTITAQLRDNDSGVDISSLVLKIDNTAVDNSKVTKSAVSGGYNISYTPGTALADGDHTVSITVADNDGNTCAAATTSFTVMTTAPTLTITSPTDNLKTKTAALTVSGTTNTDSTITIKLNGADQGSVTVNSSGAFSKDLTLSTEGENTIEVVATNLAGVTTTVTKKVIYDTTAPVISAVTITPNPVDAGATYVISVTVED